MIRLSTLALLAATSLPAGAQAPDSAAFIIRLGTDTTVVERYVRTAGRLEAEAVQRSPRTMVHRLVMDFGAAGTVTSAEWTVSPPAGAQPVLRRTIAFTGDSAIIETVQGERRRTDRVAAADAIPMAGPFYSPYELAIVRGLSTGRDSTTVTLLAGTGTAQIPIERIAPDSVALANQFGEPMRAHVDAAGRLLHLHTPAYTTVERLAWLDLPALAREFAARDEAGRGMGSLSPRETSRARVGEANLWLDYSQPGKRGRPVWGGLVPWNEVWRMGANEAAHFATDRPVELGGLALDPGTYTLFLLPTADEWTLIVNRQTGISGLDRDPEHDVGRVRLEVEELAEPVERFTLEVDARPDGAALALAWDRTRASVPIRVR